MSGPPTKTNSNPDLRVKMSETDAGVTSRKRKQPDCALTEMIHSVARELKETLKSFKTDVDSSFASMNINFAEIKSDLDSLTKNTSEIRSELSTLRTDQETLKKRLSVLENNDSDCTQRLTTLEVLLPATLWISYNNWKEKSIRWSNKRDPAT
ncbi:unnamed protein product [Arctia plantaginis]|uniref:Uncharacterized protein n=1 Tax=Arctia plantaginis TaxID=874455 RepID=A0A8S1AXE0_ARCPL|nr:unnamed protein product [Arctia plantaginis]CAB3251372.1 unnamed protein product [Arctia plantaginis]